MEDQSSNSVNLVDEAQEKLVSPAGQKIEIKFIADPHNGDTKIDISEVRHAFVGMGKEELMKFANDPFWVKMRWFLFILFWLLWFGMLAGAVAIILLAPKCSVTITHKWFLETPVYEVNVRNFKDSLYHDGFGDLLGLEEKLDHIKSLGTHTVLLNSLVKCKEGTEDVIEFMTLDPKLGQLDDFKRLVSSSKDKGVHLIMKIVPNSVSSSHEWFTKSVSGDEEYRDYFVWARPSQYDGVNPLPPNNWHSLNGGSAWAWNEQRKEYYLHQFGIDQPDLNFRNPKVIKYFENVFKFWLDHGLNGIHLDKAEYLVEDMKLANETASRTAGSIHDEYDFHSHTHTTYLPETLDILSQWADAIKNNSGIFSVSGTEYGASLRKADLIYRPVRVKSGLTAQELQIALHNRLEKPSQAWTLTCNSKEDCNNDLTQGLQAVFLVLPGVSVISSGSELGLPVSSIFQWDSAKENQGFSSVEPWKQLLDSKYSSLNLASEKQDSTSFYNTFKTIIKERHTPAILHGAINITVLESSVLTINRFKNGSPSYVFAFNLASVNRTVDLSSLNAISAKLTVIARSVNLQLPLRSVLTSKLLTIPGKSFTLLQYIPDLKED